MKAALIVLVLALSSFCGGTTGEWTGSKVLNTCNFLLNPRGIPDEEGLECIEFSGYIMGMADALAIAGKLTGSSPSPSQLQWILIIRKFILDNPDMISQPAFVIVATAMMHYNVDQQSTLRWSTEI